MTMRATRAVFVGVWLLSVSVAGLFAEAGTAPTVIKAVPDHGDTGVDPALTEIRVTFDRDMTVGSHSWVGGGPKFPKLTGKPFWEDKRTAVLPVQLEPNHEYWLSVNNPPYMNFRSVDGEAAEPYPISFTTAASGGGKPNKVLTPEANRAAIRKLRRLIDTEYSYRDRLGLDWNKLFAQHQRTLTAAKKPQDFAREAGKLLADAKDLHIWLTVGPASFASHRRAVPANMNFQTLARIVPNWTQRSNSVYSGRFDNGVGYILITTWSTEREVLGAALAALDDLIDAPGLIVDVRANSGGDEGAAQQFAGRFVTAPKVYARNLNCDPDKPGRFLGPYDRVLEPNRRGKAFGGNVAVLTGPQNMSSCEAFLLMMKQVPRCKLVGERSYGSSGNPRPFELGNGVTVYLPRWQAMRPDGTCFEGEGIEPDVVIETRPEDFRAKDPVLDAGLAHVGG